MTIKRQRRALCLWPLQACLLAELRFWNFQVSNQRVFLAYGMPEILDVRPTPARHRDYKKSGECGFHCGRSCECKRDSLLWTWFEFLVAHTLPQNLDESVWLSQFQTPGPFCINKTISFDRINGLKCGHKCMELCHHLRATLMLHVLNCSVNSGGVGQCIVNCSPWDDSALAVPTKICIDSYISLAGC